VLVHVIHLQAKAFMFERKALLIIVRIPSQFFSGGHFPFCPVGALAFS